MPNAVARETCAPVETHPFQWAVTGSNRRPPACKAGALPAELTARTKRRVHPPPMSALPTSAATATDRNMKPKEIIMAAKRPDLSRRVPPAGFEPALPP